MLLADAPALKLEEGADEPVAFQHPGLVMIEPAAGGVSICYGQGRLQNGFGPLSPVPIAQMGGDTRAFERFGRSLQFDGAKQLTIRQSKDQESPSAPAWSASGRRIAVQLGEARVIARLLEDRNPETCAAFATTLPLSGTGTNTVSSGPLVRYWNPDGGPEGETPLETEADEARQRIESPTARSYKHVILYPGHLYYNTTWPWRGIRIAAREATVMKGPVPGTGSPVLIPIAAFEGDWSAFRREAARLHLDGAKPMRFEVLE